MVRTQFHGQLATLRDEVLAVGETVASALERAVSCLQEADGATANAIVAEDRAIDERHGVIQRLSIKMLTTQQPVASDLRAITAAMVIASELERIGDYAAGIAKLVIRDPGEPPLDAPHGLYVMARTARAMLQLSLSAYETQDAVQARRIWQQDATVDHYQQALSRTLLLSMIENPSTLTRATHQLWIVHNLERVADRSTNICEQVIFMIEGEWPDLQELPTEVSADEIMPRLPDIGDSAGSAASAKG
ncbi:MAG: phosphate signaling complex protein PhoU [Thermomicrobiales bacterium]